MQAELKAKKERASINGYFTWTLMVNLEWSEGYKAKFGLMYVDINTQLCSIKNLGHWWRAFLNK